MLNEDLSKSASLWAKHKGANSTRGCPTGLTIDPCNEWQERMWTLRLKGRFLRGPDRCLTSNSCIRFHSYHWSELTLETPSTPILTILRNDAFNELGFYGIDDIVRRPRILLRIDSWRVCWRTAWYITPLNKKARIKAYWKSQFWVSHAFLEGHKPRSSVLAGRSACRQYWSTRRNFFRPAWLKSFVYI